MMGDPRQARVIGPWFLLAAALAAACGSSDDGASGDDANGDAAGSSGRDSSNGGRGGAAGNVGGAGHHASGQTSGGSAGDDSGGGTSGGDAGSGSAGETSAGAGGGGSGECPLSAEERDRAEIVIQQALAEASWITTQTHGAGVGASRAFGFGTPFTTVGVLFAATLAEACVEAKTFDEYCSGSDEDEPGPGPCSQMECLEAGKLKVKTWLEPLPFTAPAEPPPGDVEVRQAQQGVTFTEETDGSVAIEWTTNFEVVPPDAGTLSITETATGTVEAMAHEDVAGQVTVGGLGEGTDALVLHYNVGAEGVSGVATIAGEQVLELKEDGPVWLASCAH
jgi:hypothetical protein